MSCRSLRTGHGLLLGLLFAALSLTGCSGDDGQPGASTGTLTGLVSNSANGGAPVANATITTTPAVAGVTITTGADGRFTANLPVGAYALACAATNFTAATKAASVLAGVSQTIDFSLAPTSKVVIQIAGNPTNATPGSSFGLTANVSPMDGSTVQSYSWAQTNSAQATIADGNTASPTITLGDEAAYKAALIAHLPVKDRFEVIAIDPHAMELGAGVTFECTVTTTSGTYKKTVAVHAELDFAHVATGLRNLPTGAPVLVGGKDQATYDWALTKPGNSTATLMDATGRFPSFTPDVTGTYTLTVTDLAGPTVVTIPIYAGNWTGGINGVDSNGRPQTICATACHATIHNDKFVDWANTGHAEIFTDNINTGGHYGPGCFDCHTVGNGTGGFDETQNYTAFLDAMFPGGMSHPNANNWNTVLANWPEQAKMANIQCENCHGPNGTGSAHANALATDSRISVSAAVCGTCHGEPPRHARYQQWLESGHGNFQLALDEGGSASCAKCHTAQGFLAWSRMATPFDTTANPPGLTDPTDAQPITCVVCHDPHNVGTTTGETTNAPMRVQGDSPPLLGGYTARGMGKGAVCIVCHNTRRGEAEAVITNTPDQAPHLGAQGDVLMGQNAFFVVSGVRGPHSLITNTCVTCHIELTDPPADLSYQLGGTNHTFAANTAICASCHGLFDPASLKALTQAALHDLAMEITTAFEKEIAFHTAAGRTVRVTGAVNGTSTTTDITAASTVDVTELTETHGRSAMVIVINGVEHRDVRVNTDTQIINGGVASGRLLANTFSSIEENLAKACWNYNLMHADSSSGIHNPGWVTEIIAMTSAAIRANWP